MMSLRPAPPSPQRCDFLRPATARYTTLAGWRSVALNVIKCLDSRLSQERAQVLMGGSGNQEEQSSMQRTSLGEEA